MENTNTEVVKSELTSLTVNSVYCQLREKVSEYNAKLLLQSAAIKAGLDHTSEAPLSKVDAEALCLELIKNGGPAFQVGKSIYSQVQ